MAKTKRNIGQEILAVFASSNVASTVASPTCLPYRASARKPASLS